MTFETTKTLPLLKEIRQRKVEASVITTYNAYLPFYENVVLRRLSSQGSRENVVLMDGAQFSQSLADPTQRPRRAGRDYTLLPVSCSGAFHPKVILLVRRSDVVAYVGSHNLTLSGYTSNGELTTRIVFEEDSASDQERLILQQLLSFLKNTTADRPDEPRRPINRLVQDLSGRFELDSLADKDPPSNAGLHCSLGSEADLWNQVEQFFPETVEQLMVLGPYFDQRLQFLTRLYERLSPDRLVVPIDVEETQIPNGAPDMMPRAKFTQLDTSTDTPSDGFLHAKALYAIDADGRGYQVTGSANPSARAWLKSSSRSNAEVVFCKELSADEVKNDPLGLRRLFESPTLADSRWEDAGSALLEEEDEPSYRATLAFRRDGKIYLETDMLTTPPTEITEVRALDSRHEVLESTTFSIDKDLVEVRTTSHALDEVSWLELRTSQGCTDYALVHHTSRIDYQSFSDEKRAVRYTITQFQEDNAELSELLSVVEDVIFSSDQHVTEGGKASRKSTAVDHSNSETVGPLVVDPADETGESGDIETKTDLALLLDALIESLRSSHGIEQTVLADTREEELVGTDEDPTSDIKDSLLEGKSLRKFRSYCRSRLRELNKQLKKSLDESPDRLLRGQIASVFAIVGELYRRQATLQEYGAGSLVSPGLLADVFFVAPWQALSGPEGILAAESDEEHISMIQGLSLWAGCIRRIHRPLQQLRELQGDLIGNWEQKLDEHLQSCSYFLEVVASAGRNERAVEFARRALEWSFPGETLQDAEALLDSYVETGQRLVRDMNNASTTEPIKWGVIVIWKPSESAPLLVRRVSGETVKTFTKPKGIQRPYLKRVGRVFDYIPD